MINTSMGEMIPTMCESSVGRDGLGGMGRRVSGAGFVRLWLS